MADVAVAGLTAKGVLALWVLFREARETSLPLASRPGGDFTLVGRPVRIDDSVEGLTYGQLDD